MSFIEDQGFGTFQADCISDWDAYPESIEAKIRLVQASADALRKQCGRFADFDHPEEAVEDLFRASTIMFGPPMVVLILAIIGVLTNIPQQLAVKGRILLNFCASKTMKDKLRAAAKLRLLGAEGVAVFVFASCLLAVTYDAWSDGSYIDWWSDIFQKAGLIALAWLCVRALVALMAAGRSG
jgi:hypothetical protein